MPKLIVYVKADTWRRVEDGFGEGAPAVMRDVSVRAIEELLSEREREDGDAGHGSAASVEGVGAVSQTRPPSRSESDDHFRPDFGSKLK